jgi:hypothetical protein
MMMHYCDSAPAAAVSASVAVSGTSQASLTWTVRVQSADAGIGVSPKGDLDFSLKAQPIWVTLSLSDPNPNVIFFPSAPIGFADRFEDGYGDGTTVQPVPVGADHRQISDLTLIDSKTIKFCYRNHRPQAPANDPGRFKHSRYVIYLADSTNPTAYLPYWIDPQIGNR